MKDKRKQSSARNVWDLRSAIRLLERTPGQLLTTDDPVHPQGALAGLYKPIGAGTPVILPTHPIRSGPALQEH